MQKIQKNWFQTIITAVILFGITTVLYLYSSGYRLNRESEEIDFKQTGMVGAKSIPEGANIYLDGELKTATNDTIPGIEPGEHSLRIIKNGYVVWEKNIEIFPELVTDITAILVSQSPKLEPLTNTGAAFPVISPSLTKLAFFSKDGTSPGVWVIPLTDGTLSLFRTNPYVVAEDTPSILFSRGTKIEWSPDETNLLVTGTEELQHYLVDLDTNVVEATSSPELVKQTWADELVQKRTDFVEKLDLPEGLLLAATDPETLWAPDDQKFLYKTESNGNIEYRVYNMEKPIPVGEKVENVVLTLPASEPQPELSWYSDSFHLILTENYNPEDNTGRISLIRIDGTNKTEVYNNTLFFDKVFSAPGGDKLIILTSFKSGDQTDLYTIGIR